MNDESKRFSHSSIGRMLPLDSSIGLFDEAPVFTLGEIEE